MPEAATLIFPISVVVFSRIAEPAYFSGLGDLIHDVILEGLKYITIKQ